MFFLNHTTIVWPIEAFFAQKSCGLLQEINIDWLVNLFTFLLLEHTFLIHKSRATVIWQIWTESRQASSFHCNYDFSKQKERHRLKERNLKDGVIQVVQSTDGIVQFGWNLYSFPILSYAESALLTKSANCIFLKKVEDTQFYSFSLYKRQRGWQPQPWGNTILWFDSARLVQIEQWLKPLNGKFYDNLFVFFKPRGVLYTDISLPWVKCQGKEGLWQKIW